MVSRHRATPSDDGRPASAPVIKLDGRRARGERTRLQVLDALLAFIEEGAPNPTAQEVATRAGVSLRTVYHHFDHVEALRRAALDLDMERSRQYLRPIDATLPLAERIALVAHQCRTLFEALTPVRRATLPDEQSAGEVAEGLRRVRMARRDHFLEALLPGAEERARSSRALLDGVDVACSWDTWFSLRDNLGRSAAAAERTVATTLASLFGVDLAEVERPGG